MRAGYPGTTAGTCGGETRYIRQRRVSAVKAKMAPPVGVNFVQKARIFLVIIVSYGY